MCGSFNDLVLQRPVEIDEILAVSADPDDHVRVFFRFFLRLAQDLVVQEHDLQLGAALVKIGPDEAGQHGAAARAPRVLAVDLDVQRVAARHGGEILLQRGVQQLCRAADVLAL